MDFSFLCKDFPIKDHECHPRKGTVKFANAYKFKVPLTSFYSDYIILNTAQIPNQNHLSVKYSIVGNFP